MEWQMLRLCIISAVLAVLTFAGYPWTEPKCKPYRELNEWMEFQFERKFGSKKWEYRCAYVKEAARLLRAAPRRYSFIEILDEHTLPESKKELVRRFVKQHKWKIWKQVKNHFFRILGKHETIVLDPTSTTFEVWMCYGEESSEKD
ncbi:unnamed protein product [Cylicostephanus goldi]|uniref:Uncharacterized protein n=1 Tax=Cylicostephanus goldi TaxID=71465 RepID=A0A3P6QZE2_CYLGO|nr:unnamed protein product [Cylicostephanus goldi]